MDEAPIRLRSSRNIIAFATVVLAVVAIVCVETAHNGFPINTYKAFYCGGQAILTGSNPYSIEPLRSCEHRIFAAPSFPAFGVEPAPLPGFALAGFAIFALMAPRVSHLLFLAALLAALFVTGWALGGVTRRSPALVTLVCLSAWLMSAADGEISPFFVAWLAMCGLALERNRPALAGLCACGAMIQPHLAAPLALALFLLVPRSRVALLAGGAVLLGIDVLATGGHVALAYATTYLPLHAVSEIGASDQYSLTHVLHLAGAPDRAALIVGSLSYAAMVVVGTIAGSRLSRALNVPSLVAFAPPAFVLLGGTFVHDVQMFAAIPLVVALVSYIRPVPWWLVVAAALLCINWNQAGSKEALIFAAISAFAMGCLVFGAGKTGVAKALVLAAALSIALLSLDRLPTSSAARISSVSPRAFSPQAPASQAWSALLQSVPLWSQPSLRSEGRKLPTWIGLGLLVVFCLRKRRPRAGASVAYGTT